MQNQEIRKHPYSNYPKMLRMLREPRAQGEAAGGGSCRRGELPEGGAAGGGSCRRGNKGGLAV